MNFTLSYIISKRKGCKQIQLSDQRKRKGNERNSLVL